MNSFSIHFICDWMQCRAIIELIKKLREIVAILEKKIKRSDLKFAK